MVHSAFCIQALLWRSWMSVWRYVGRFSDSFPDVSLWTVLDWPTITISYNQSVRIVRVIASLNMWCLCLKLLLFVCVLQANVTALTCVCTCEGDYGVMTSAGVRAEPEEPFRLSNPHKGPTQTHTCLLPLLIHTYKRSQTSQAHARTWFPVNGSSECV